MWEVTRNIKIKVLQLMGDISMSPSFLYHFAS